MKTTIVHKTLIHFILHLIFKLHNKLLKYYLIENRYLLKCLKFILLTIVKNMEFDIAQNKFSACQ